MSYDVTLRASDGDEVFWRNHTSNTAPMWRKAGCDLWAFHGRKARELGVQARFAATEIYVHPEEYASMEPPNGWGTAVTTIRFLDDIATACADYPDTTVEVSA